MTDRNTEKLDGRAGLALHNNSVLLERLKKSGAFLCARMTNRKLRKTYAAYRKEEDPDRRLNLSGEVLDLFDGSLVKRGLMLTRCCIDDMRVCRYRIGHRKAIDNSDSGTRDYYSVVVIVKNEARYIREFILFYQATGADRIYLYDNDSTDNLLEEIEPFLKSGLVVYVKWPGKIVQTAAYRDAVRRTRNRTTWLAVIDADEFLFSPKGNMPEQLRHYEDYPAVGVNWRAFGPNSHDRRPAGLIMDNYTTTPAGEDYLPNCHIKSIVQPKKVLTTNHPHFSYYRKNELAVNERKEKIGNRNAYTYSAGRAFTEDCHTEVFQINHYQTKSLEDLEEKCSRGYADGAPNPVPEQHLRAFRVPLMEDFTIKPYADIVREKY